MHCVASHSSFAKKTADPTRQVLTQRVQLLPHLLTDKRIAPPDVKQVKTRKYGINISTNCNKSNDSQKSLFKNSEEIGAWHSKARSSFLQRGCVLKSELGSTDSTSPDALPRLSPAFVPAGLDSKDAIFSDMKRFSSYVSDLYERSAEASMQRVPKKLIPKRIGRRGGGGRILDPDLYSKYSKMQVRIGVF